MKTELSIIEDEELSPELMQKMHAYWRAANYLSVGQLYLRHNPLLKEPLKLEHVKNMLLGHWGTTPGDRKSTRLNSSHERRSRMPSSA